MSEQQYLDLLQHILDNGDKKEDRTGVGTLSVFGAQMRFDLRESFPALTTKKLAFKSVVSELIWFLEGSTDERRLAEIHYGKYRLDIEDKTTIWTANADQQGVELGYTNNRLSKILGPVYGKQWRDWNGTGIDQIENLIHDLKNNPNSRRHILTAWNVEQIDKMALPPCHMMCQFHVNSKNELSCQLYQRSADMFLGVPFNIASYSLLTHMLAQVCNLTVGDYVHTIGDAHIYLNHIGQVKEQLSREPYDFPKLEMNTDINNINEFSMKDFNLLKYEHHPYIKADMAV